MILQVAGAPERDGVALLSAQRRKLARYPQLARGVRTACAFWPQRSGGAGTTTPSILYNAWSPCGHAEAVSLRAAASQGWARRWWGCLAVAAQRAACSAVLGIWTLPPLPNADSELPLAEAQLIPLAARLLMSCRPDQALRAGVKVREKIRPTTSADGKKERGEEKILCSVE